MTDATKDRRPEDRGFSSRWMLDGRERRTHQLDGDAKASATPLDTNGDGVADTLSVRVDAHRPSAMARFGTWVGRSLMTIVFIAALVAAAAAATSLVQTRAELDDTKAALTAERAATADARQDAEAAAARANKLELDAATAVTDGTQLEAERDELELEVEVLRGMLLDAERRAADKK